MPQTAVGDLEAGAGWHAHGTVALAGAAGAALSAGMTAAKSCTPVMWSTAPVFALAALFSLPRGPYPDFTEERTARWQRP